MTNTITPNYAKNLRKLIKLQMAEIRGDIEQARALRAKGGVLALENAEGHLSLVRHNHNLVRANIRKLNSSKVVKYSNLSDAAAARRHK